MKNAGENGYFDEYARLYDILTSHKDYNSEAAALMGFLDANATRLNDVPKLLSVGCGVGSHEKIIDQRRRWEITAIDSSPGMIAAAQSGFASPSLVFSSQKLAELPCEYFGAAISLFNVVNCLKTVKQLRSFFSQVHERLAPQGGFFFEAWHGDLCVKSPPQEVTRVYRDDGRRCLLTRRASPKLIGDRLTIEYAISGSCDGREVSLTSVHKLRLFTRDELVKSLVASGFEFVHCASSLPELAAFDRDACRMLSVFAVKSIARP